MIARQSKMLKRVLIAALALLCMLPLAQSQGNLMIWGPSGGSGSCSQSSAFFARAGTLDTTHHNAYDTMICGLVTDGVWSAFDAFYVLGTDTASNANLNLVSSSFALTPHGSPTFTANSGYNGADGSTTIYLDTGFNPSTVSGNYTLNTAHFMVWSCSVGAATANAIGGVDDNTEVTQIVPWFTDGQSYVYANSSAGSAVFFSASSSAKGSFVVSRATNAVAGYRNGTLLSTGTFTPVGLPVGNVYLLAKNASGSASAGSADIVSAASLGGTLSSGQVTAIQSRIGAFQIAVNGSSC
jgi:hypothetical protein